MKSDLLFENDDIRFSENDDIRYTENDDIRYTLYHKLTFKNYDLKKKSEIYDNLQLFHKLIKNKEARKESEFDHTNLNCFGYTTSKYF